MEEAGFTEPRPIQAKGIPEPVTAHLVTGIEGTTTVRRAAVGGPPMPNGAGGWAAMLGAGVVQAVSIPLLYVALPIIGEKTMKTSSRHY